MITLAEIIDKIIKNPSKSEKETLQLLIDGKVADFGKGEKIDLTQASNWGPERTITADFIRRICSDPDKVKGLRLYGIRIRGAKIEGQLDLSSLIISLNISLRECFIPQPIDLRHTSASELDLSGSQTNRIEADCLSVSGDMRLAEGFSAQGPVSLISATIKGNLCCTNGHFGNLSAHQDTTKISACRDCRASMLHAYSLVLERAKIGRSLNLCGGFTAKGGVHLSDTTIGDNLNCTKGKFEARSHGSNHTVKTNGRRLGCETDSEHHLACAFNGEGMHVKGNLILNEVDVLGEMRLTSAVIDGDLDSANGHYDNQCGNAIHADRLSVRGNIFFCDGFDAKGTIRLPRAKIGADLSFCRGVLVNSIKNSPVIQCVGIHINGTMYLRNFNAEDGYVDLSFANIEGNLDCTDSSFKNPNGWALKANGMKVQGSAFLCSSDGGNFQSIGLVSMTGASLGSDLICTNGQFSSDKPCELEEDTPCAIKADNMIIAGKVNMNGYAFKATGVNLNNTQIGSYLNCENGTFKAPLFDGNDKCAITAGKLQVGGSIYFNDEFKAQGEIMLNDASIGRNLNLSKGSIINEGDYSLQAMQMKVAGSVNMDNFVSYGEVKINYSTIGGNLKCPKAEFINNKERKGKQESSDCDGKRYAFRANGLKVVGCVEFKDGFYADGIVSLKNADIGMSFIWNKITDPAKAGLFLDSTKAGVLEDDMESWPAKNNLQINDFEYKFLMELSTEGLKSRREKWLKLPRDFRTQPYEHLAAVLKRSGYEEEAKKVLIEKNKAQTSLPARWPWAKWLNQRCPLKDGYLQNQSPLTWILRLFYYFLIRYGYKPSRAAYIGLFIILVGWGMFYLGFTDDVLVPTKDRDKTSIYQTAIYENGKLTKNYVLYSLVYSLETFSPVGHFQVADYWLPTANPTGVKDSDSCISNWLDLDQKKFGFVLCIYRWFHIISGWVVAIFYGAALSGLVRK